MLRFNNFKLDAVARKMMQTTLGDYLFGAPCTVGQRGDN